VCLRRLTLMPKVQTRGKYVQIRIFTSLRRHRSLRNMAGFEDRRPREVCVGADVVVRQCLAKLRLNGQASNPDATCGTLTLSST
jgi:hypothetical protein